MLIGYETDVLPTALRRQVVDRLYANAIPSYLKVSSTGRFNSP